MTPSGTRWITTFWLTAPAMSAPIGVAAIWMQGPGRAVVVNEGSHVGMLVPTGSGGGVSGSDSGSNESAPPATGGNGDDDSNSGPPGDRLP